MKKANNSKPNNDISNNNNKLYWKKLFKVERKV